MTSTYSDPFIKQETKKDDDPVINGFRRSDFEFCEDDKLFYMLNKVTGRRTTSAGYTVTHFLDGWFACSAYYMEGIWTKEELFELTVHVNKDTIEPEEHFKFYSVILIDDAPYQVTLFPIGEQWYACLFQGSNRFINPVAITEEEKSRLFSSSKIGLPLSWWKKNMMNSYELKLKK